MKMKNLRLREIGLIGLIVALLVMGSLFVGNQIKVAKFDPRVVMAAVVNPSPASPGYMMVNLSIPGTQTSGGVIGTKTNVSRFKMPWPATLLAVSGIYRTGGAITVDVTENGSSVLSIPLLINSTTAASEGVISDSAIADEALIGINIVAGALCYDPTVQLIFKRK
jgi:hypothetical protein